MGPPLENRASYQILFYMYVTLSDGPYTGIYNSFNILDFVCLMGGWLFLSSAIFIPLYIPFVK